MDGEAESTSLFGNREAIEKSRWTVGVEVIGTVFYSLTHVGIIAYAAVMRVLVIYARPVRVVPSWPIRALQIESVSLATSHALLSKLPKRKVSLLFSLLLFHPVCSPLPSVALVYFSKFPYLALNTFYQRWTRRTSISVPSTMPQWPLPFVPYPSSKDGYWSPVTSTLNWCEEVNKAFSFFLISWRELTLYASMR